MGEGQGELLEGFGLPAIEAMACGTPVVASDRGSLPEVLGDAGRFFDPSRSGPLLTVLREVLESELVRDTMKQRGLGRVQQFTWDIAARKTISIFHDLVN